MRRLACIDLGTNTFHLLIVSVENNRFIELYRKREYVILAEQGIETIGQMPLSRAFAAIDLFKVALDDYAPDQLTIIGTEALRKASNGNLVTEYIKDKLGIEAEIIDGQREASLILKGTQLMVDMSVGHFCIMDIGGGSVEFILIKDGDVLFMESFPIGVTVLNNRFHKSDPISEDEQISLSNYLDKQLDSLIKQFKRIDDNISLIGASGSYEVLQLILEGAIRRDDVSRFSTEQFNAICKTVIQSTEAERSRIDGIPEQRKKLIVVAFMLIKKIVDSASMKTIIVSPYALKEGVLSESMSSLL